MGDKSKSFEVNNGQSCCFNSIHDYQVKDRTKQIVVSDLDGTLLRSPNGFPYYMLMAFEAGGYIRAWLLLLMVPLISFLYRNISEVIGLNLIIFISFAGLREQEVQSVAKAVLPKFYAEDVHDKTWKIFSAFQKRIINTAAPRVMVEHFAKTYLGVDHVSGTEIQVIEIFGIRYYTGLVASPGVMVSMNKVIALHNLIGDSVPDVGLGDRSSDFPFMLMCKEQYLVPSENNSQAAPSNSLCNIVYFHDGRLVHKPKVKVAFFTLLWLPIGVVLCILRLFIYLSVPKSWVPTCYKYTGIQLSIKGHIPPFVEGGKGYLFVCNHRTLLDPIILSIALQRPVTAVTYSISRVSELLSPIKTKQLTRNKEKDSAILQKLLAEGDVVVCPEGTTCREPFLLRFSALFTELSDQIVPVALNTTMDMLHATTARGWKGLDSFFFYMNLNPKYEITFLEKLLSTQLPGAKYLDAQGNEQELTTFDVANNIQKMLAAELGFQCTNLTRKDKYKILTGIDGVVPKRKICKQKKKSI